MPYGVTTPRCVLTWASVALWCHMTSQISVNIRSGKTFAWQRQIFLVSGRLKYAIARNQHHCCQWPGDARNCGINSHSIDKINFSWNIPVSARKVYIFKFFKFNVLNMHSRVSHNQGYHLVCTWGQKWSFLHCPKNNCTWKSIDYSVWNPNFAKLSLIFIEIYKFENPSLTRHFRVRGATQCWYDIHFYWVLLMIIFNWTY